MSDAKESGKCVDEFCQQVKHNRTTFPNFDKELHKKTMERSDKAVQNDFAISNAMIVYNGMNSEVDANEV